MLTVMKSEGSVADDLSLDTLCDINFKGLDVIHVRFGVKCDRDLL